MENKGISLEEYKNWLKENAYKEEEKAYEVAKQRDGKATKHLRKTKNKNRKKGKETAGEEGKKN